MNKKAITEQILMNLIMLAIVVVLIAVTGTIVGRLLGGKAGESGSAMTNLDSLALTIRELVLRPARFDVVRDYPLAVQSNRFILVAFNPGDSRVHSTCWDEDELDNIYVIGSWLSGPSRPEGSCGMDKACLCTYPDVIGDLGDDIQPDFSDAPSRELLAKGFTVPAACQEFPGNFFFYAPANSYDAEGGDTSSEKNAWNFGGIIGTDGNYNPSGAESIRKLNEELGGGPFQRFMAAPFKYENLLVYGECEKMDWGEQPVYIEHYFDGKTHWIYISKEGIWTRQRYGVLNNALSTSVQAIQEELSKGELAKAFILAYRFVVKREGEPDYPQVVLLLAEIYEKLAAIEKWAEPHDQYKPNLAMQVLYHYKYGALPNLGLDDPQHYQRLKAAIEGAQKTDPVFGYRRALLYEAAKTYRSFWKKNPDHEKAPEALVKALEFFFAAADYAQGKDENAAQQFLKEAEALRQEAKVSGKEYVAFALLQVDYRLLASAHEQGKQVDATALRNSLTAFIAGNPKPEYRKPALYLLAESYLKLPPTDDAAVKEALKTYVQILQQYADDYKHPGASDPKEIIWLRCFTGKYPDLEQQCEQAVKFRPPQEPADLSDVGVRKSYYDAIRNFAEQAEPTSQTVALATYYRFLNVYKTESGALKYSESADYELLTRTHLVIAKLFVKSNPFLAESSVFLAKSYLPLSSLPADEQDKLQGVLDELQATVQICKEAMQKGQSCPTPSI